MEIFQSIRDERLTTCPACQKEGLKRLIGKGAGIIFKGSGFYQTDYKGDASKPAAAENGGGGKSDSGSESGGKPAASESKPASSSAPVASSGAAAGTSTTTT